MDGLAKPWSRDCLCVEALCHQYRVYCASRIVLEYSVCASLVECRRDAVLRELQSLWTVYVKDPILGVKHTIEDVSDGATSSIPIPRREDDVEIVDSAETADTMAAYLADAAKTSDREPVFCADLGLAVESLPPGYTVSKLWTA